MPSGKVNRFLLHVPAFFDVTDLAQVMDPCKHSVILSAKS